MDTGLFESRERIMELIDWHTSWLVEQSLMDASYAIDATIPPA